MREALGLSQAELSRRTQATPWPASRTTIAALEAGRHAPAMHVVMGICDVLHVDPMEVMDRFRRAVPGPPASLDLDALDARSKELFGAGQFRETLSVLDEMMARITRTPAKRREELARLRAAVEVRRATTLRRLGALTAARGSAERATDLCRPYLELLADAYVILSEARLRLGNLSLGVDAANRAVEVAEGCGADVQARAWNEKGRALLDSGRFKDACDAFVKSRQCATRGGDDVHRIHGEGNHGVALLQQGKRSTARDRFKRAIDLARRLRRPALQALWLVELGGLALAQGRFDEVERLSKEAIAIAQPLTLWDTVFRAELLLHRVARARNPEDPDRHRRAYLRKLTQWVEEDLAKKDVQEFLAELRAEGEKSPRGRS